MEQERWDEYGFVNPIYNSVRGYLPTGGYLISPQKTDIPGVYLPGFVVDFLQGASLAAKSSANGVFAAKLAPCKKSTTNPGK